MNIKHAVAISINSELFVRVWESEFIDLEGCQTYKEVKVHESHKYKLLNIILDLTGTIEYDKQLEQGITISPELIEVRRDCECCTYHGICINGKVQLFAFIKEAKEETNEAHDYRQKLFDYMLNEHGVTLLESDMAEIENIINPKKYPYTF